MRTIWKYEVGLGEINTLVMPEDAELLRFDMQNGAMCLWAVVDDANQRESRRFRVAGTGFELRDLDRYVGTTQDGQFVWHLFEVMS